MGSLKDTDLESFTRLSEDIAKHKASAAKALKRFKIAYNEIMGCSSESDVSSEVQQFETETSELSSLSNTNDMPNVIHNKSLHNSTRTFHKTFNPLHISQSNRCIYCRYATSSKVPYVPLNENLKFQNFDRHWCYKCAASEGDKVVSSDDEVSVICHNPISKHDEKRKSSVCNELYNNPVKVTVPEPFTMTVREESQKYIKELKIQKLKDELNEKVEKEMQIKIRSNPAPAHIYVPLYKKMMELSLARKEIRREKSLERTKDIIRPFNISNRKQLRKSDSMPNLQVEGKSCLFKAKPVPKSILSTKVSEKLKNDEIIRQARIHQRAKETLTHSTLPFTLSESVKTTSFAKSKIDKSTNSNIKVYKTKSDITTGGNKVVIDWDAKVKKTVCQKKHYTPPIVNEVTHGERYKKFLKAQDKSLEHYIRVTQGSILRESEIRKEIKEREANDMSTNIPHRKEIRRHIRKKLQDVISPNCQKDMEEKLKTYRKSRKQRQIEYEQELMEMRKRIAKKPLLLERQSTTKLSQPEMKNKSTNTDTANSDNDNGNNSGTLSSGLSLESSEDNNSSLEDSG